MNGEITLREVCIKLNISRRTIQGYQQKGLIQPDSKNKYGHLLFSTATLKRIAIIRFYQRIGFSLEDIVALFAMPNEKQIQRMQDKLLEMESAQQNLLILQKKTKKVIQSLMNSMDMDDIYEIIQGGK